MLFRNINSHRIRLLLLAVGCIALFTQCETEDDEFAVNPNKLTIVAKQANNLDLIEGFTGVKVDADFTIVFSNPVDPTRAIEATSFSSSAGTPNLNISFNDNSSIMGITPSDSLEFETDYTITIRAGALGLENERLENDFVLSFTTDIEPMPLFEAGLGTEESPYLIASADQLNIVRQFKSSFFRVINDIDLGELTDPDPLGWEPLGDLLEPFIGNFDGGGFTISGLNIQRPEATEIGLFGVLDGSGIIQNVSVQVTGISGGQATGALVGRQLNGTIQNCSSSGSITGTNSRVGGLVGSQEAGLITQCASSCGVFAELSRVGGLVGLSQAGTVMESYASGNSESLSSRVGGVVGSVEADATVMNCYATGNVTARNRGGGAFGRLDGSASNCYATGIITITDADASGDYPGNVIGQAGSGSSFSGMYYPNDQTINYDGGADITEDGSSVNISSFSCADPKSSFPEFDFDTIWSCTSDGTWMVLSWQ